MSFIELFYNNRSIESKQNDVPLSFLMGEENLKSRSDTYVKRIGLLREGKSFFPSLSKEARVSFPSLYLYGRGLQ